MPDSPPPTSSSRSRYDDLLDAASELFSEHGFEGTTVRMIAARMGILSGSLYSHVSSKEDLLRQVTLRVGERFVQRGEQAVADADDATAALRGLCRAHLEVLSEDRSAVTVYYNEWRRLSPEAKQEIIALRDRYEQLVRQTIEAGVAQEVFAAPDVRMAAVVVLSVLNWTYQWYRPEGSAGPRELADTYAQALLDGLARR